MKKLFFLFLFLGMVLTAMADWSYGTVQFKGSQPSSSMTHGNVRIWYNGTLRQTGVSGGVEEWEGTGDICVVYPKDYSGRSMHFTSSGGSVQIRYLK